MICADGLSGMKEAVAAAYPQTELQRCIVHQVRNTLKYVGEKNKKEFANDLKTIYQAPSEKAALERISERYSTFKGSVSGNNGDIQKNGQCRFGTGARCSASLRQTAPLPIHLSKMGIAELSVSLRSVLPVRNAVRSSSVN